MSACTSSHVSRFWDVSCGARSLGDVIGGVGVQGHDGVRGHDEQFLVVALPLSVNVNIFVRLGNTQPKLDE